MTGDDTPGSAEGDLKVTLEAFPPLFIDYLWVLLFEIFAPIRMEDPLVVGVSTGGA
jgi:hypothetical protein